MLVTHHVQYLSKCDLVVILEDGRIKAAGSYAELQYSGIDINSFISQLDSEQQSGKDGATDDQQTTDALGPPLDHPDTILNKIDEANDDDDDDDGEITMEQVRRHTSPRPALIKQDSTAPVDELDAEFDNVRNATAVDSDTSAVDATADHTTNNNNNKPGQEQEQAQSTPEAEDQVSMFSPDELTEAMQQQKQRNHSTTNDSANHHRLGSIDSTSSTPLQSEEYDRKVARVASKAASAWRKKDIRESAITTKEEKNEGDVAFNIYSFYVKAGGIFLFSLMILAVLCAQLFNLLAAYWLQYWGTVSEREEATGDKLTTNENVYFLNIYAALACISLFFYVCRSVVLANHRLGTSKALHEHLLAATTCAPIAFFDVTPIGRILNRFSSDLLVVDEELSQTLSQLTNSFASVVGAIGAIAGATKGLFLIALIPIGFFYERVQRFFRNSNTAIARIESVSRSPIYADFSQALNGATSIRAYNDQDRFINSLEVAVDNNSTANVLQQNAFQWLSIRLDSIGAFISFFIALIAAATGDFLPAGFIALGLTYSFQLTAFLKFAVRMIATLEAQMNSVERIKYYIDTIPKEGNDRENHDSSYLPMNWPEQGVITGDKISMRYRDGPLVLKDISFTVNGSEKVGIAGRTGSGKSSLMNALFRIQELSSGTMFIDGVDTSTIPLRALRSKLGMCFSSCYVFSRR